MTAAEKNRWVVGNILAAVRNARPLGPIEKKQAARIVRAAQRFAKAWLEPDTMVNGRTVGEFAQALCTTLGEEVKP